MYGMASKSLVVNSVSPRALTFLLVSMISSRSLAWTSGYFASSYKPHAIYFRSVVSQHQREYRPLFAYSDGGGFMGCKHDRPNGGLVVNFPAPKTKRARRTHLICGMISSSRSLASSFAEAFALTTGTLSSTSAETRHRKEETVQRRDMMSF
jgi:hypothetical protein